MSSADENWNDGPFGMTDAARVDLKAFLSITGVFADPRVTKGSLNSRLVIGRKGSGKTMYLRVLQEAAEQRDLLTLKEYDSLSTSNIIYFLKRVREYVYTMDRAGQLEAFIDRRKSVVSVWRLIWDRAIALSVFSICVDFLRRETGTFAALRNKRVFWGKSDNIDDFVTDQFSSIFEFRALPVSPQAALISFGEHFESSRQLQKFLNNSSWNDLRRLTSAIVPELPPIAIYIDAIDEEFESAPEAWLICQQGLFRSVIHATQTSDSSAGRIHIVTALRDIVYAAALRSEHATRSFQSRSIKDLEWAPDQIRVFFHLKLAAVLKIPSNSKSLDGLIKSWLGFESLVNGRGVKENVAQYIMRHSRMLPRDIVLFGNAISEEIQRRSESGKSFKDESLRKSIAIVSKLVCREAIDICINELLTSSDYLEQYVEISRNKDPNIFDYRNYIDNKIKKFFDDVQFEIFEPSKLKKALISSELCSQTDFAPGNDAFYRFDNLLWRHGLLACQQRQGQNSVWTFNWKGAASSDLRPEKAIALGFHASVIDYFGVSASKEGPVW